VHEQYALVQTRTEALVASYLYRCKIAVVVGQNTPIASTSDIHSIDLFEYLHEYRVLVWRPCAMGVVPAHLVSHLYKHQRHEYYWSRARAVCVLGVGARSQSCCWRFADRYTDHQSWTHDPCARRQASTFFQVEAIRAAEDCDFDFGLTSRDDIKMDKELEAAAGEAREHTHLLSKARRRMEGDARTITHLEARIEECYGKGMGDRLGLGKE